MKKLKITRDEEFRDYKEFKLWYRHVKNMLHIFNLEQLTELLKELIDSAQDVNIDSSVEELKGLVKIKQMIIKVEQLINEKTAIINITNKF